MAVKIRIKNITNSLYQMEKWARFLRLALYQMDPSMLVSTDDQVVPSPGLKLTPPRLAMGCPPSLPEHDPDCNCPDCNDNPKKHHGKGHGKGSGKGGGKGSGKGPKKKAARK